MDYRATSPYPADEVYATMVDAGFLRARLQHMGGQDAQLLEHRADATSARYALRHGLSPGDLPPIVASLLPGNIVIERTETLRREEPGRYSGDVSVLVRGTPATAAGWMRLEDRATGGSELQVHADVTVQVPFIGSKIEAVIADQIAKLIDAETSFTLDWLTRTH